MKNTTRNPEQSKRDDSRTPLCGWQGKRREQVEFSATLVAASFAALFLIAVTLWIISFFK